MKSSLKERFKPLLPKFEKSYQKAAKAEDERQGYYRDQADKWFKAAIVLAVLLAASQYYGFVLGKQPKVKPYYVEMDERGNVTNIIAAENVEADISESARQKEVETWIENARSVTLDDVVNSDRTSRAYRQATPAAQRKLALYYESGGENGTPMAATYRSQDVTVTVKDFTISKRAGTNNSYSVRWKEEIYNRNTGSLIEGSPQPWVADITIAIVPPKNEQQLREFPLGVYIADFNWSQD
jgi:type IV secretion system protein VirB5